jgi:cell wall-associated NlpC family hydrolase
MPSNDCNSADVALGLACRARRRCPARREVGEVNPTQTRGPYVWGAEGLKSYDCSGFVWRSFRDAGVFFQLTTVPKTFHGLPVATSNETSRVGTLVFFDRLRHVAIVRNATEFYTVVPPLESRGTVRDNLNSYWPSRVCGYRIIGRH